MSSDIVVQVNNLGKRYHIYDKPGHRLLQVLFGWRKKFYKEFWALNNVSFSIKRGEAVGIIGLNGSGKSTLLRMICGTLHPTTGGITINGRVGALLELGSGFNMEFTGRENVFLYAALFGLSQEEIKDKFPKIEAFADIGDFIDKPVKTYSSGMYVRLAFSVIANINADILIIDEALSVGDAFFQQKCMRFLRSFHETGTLIFVSHDSGAVINLCDRALWLNAGNLLLDASPSDVVEAYMANLYEISQGKSDKNFHRKVDAPIKQIQEAPKQETHSADIPAPYQFNKNAACFGTGDAIIQDVFLENDLGVRLSRVIGGERVSLCISALICKDVEQPIFGFQVKDRLGQVVFGNNSYHKYERQPVNYRCNDRVTAKFTFVMPALTTGVYTIQAALANGTLFNHVQLHWIHDAMIFEIQATNNIRAYFEGMIYVPMQNIKIDNSDSIHDTKDNIWHISNK